MYLSFNRETLVMILQFYLEFSSALRKQVVS